MQTHIGACVAARLDHPLGPSLHPPESGCAGLSPPVNYRSITALIRSWTSSPALRCKTMSLMLSAAVPHARCFGFTHDKCPFPQRCRTTMPSDFGAPNVNSAIYLAAEIFCPKYDTLTTTPSCAPGTNMQPSNSTLRFDSTNPFAPRRNLCPALRAFRFAIAAGDGFPVGRVFRLGHL